MIQALLITTLILGNFYTMSYPPSNIAMQNGEKAFCQEHTIANNTDEAYYTWVYLGNIEREGLISMANDSIVFRYFHKPNGDFCFAQLMYDNIVISQFTPIVGSFFLKRIEPGESFKYVVISKTLEALTCGFTIHYQTKRKVESVLGLSIPAVFLFKNNSVEIIL